MVHVYRSLKFPGSRLYGEVIMMFPGLFTPGYVRHAYVMYSRFRLSPLPRVLLNYRSPADSPRNNSIQVA